ncbi:MAG TPA: hypothetical protein VE088_08670 [Gaiellaceae bacterium]|nr:hypothetical protein [Gaiellaceae bacterium]
MTTFDDQDIELDFFEETETAESQSRPRRRGGGPRRPGGGPPPGTVAVARLAGFVLLAIAVVVGLAVWIGGGRSTHDEYASYMDAVRPLAQDSAHAGTVFASALGAPNLKLAGLEAKLRAWSQQEQQDYARAEQLRPPGPLQSAHQQLLATFQLRALGFAGLANVLAQAKPGDTAAAATQLATQAQLFSSSDIVWSELYRQPATETLKNAGVTGVIVPTSQFVSNPEVISSGSFAIVLQRIVTASGSTGAKTSGVHGSALIGAVAAAGGKTTTLSTTTPTTIVMSQDLALRVTFEDSGNFPEGNIPVTLKVTVGGSTVYSQKQIVTSISPKQQATVTFRNLQVSNSAFGHSAFITVAVGKVPGEVKLDNNSAKYPVFFSLAQG